MDRFEPHASGPRRALRPWTLAALSLAVALAGCQTRFPSEQVPKMKWLIVPFNQPAVLGETPPPVRGWWFGARTIRENPRAGIMLSETLNRRMAALKFLNLYTSIDLKYYFADKRKLLKDAYAQMTDAEIETALRNVAPIEFGKELSADKVLSGRIVSQYMAENRTFHWWWGVLVAELQVTDVATGKIEWSRVYSLSQQFASQSDMQEMLADRLIDDLEQNYFKPMIKKSF
jgi:PBP1b-binding outer membrane lipoprotein LpoB